MKVKIPKLSEEEIRRIAGNPDARVDVADPWWVICLKVVAYLIGLILTGVGTASAANILF